MIVIQCGSRRPVGGAIALRPRPPLCAARAVREGSLRRFVANRVSAVAIGGRARSTVLPCMAHGHPIQDGRWCPAGGVAKGARIAPRRRRIGGASERRRRGPGSFPSLPWPRRAANARGDRARAEIGRAAFRGAAWGAPRRTAPNPRTWANRRRRPRRRAPRRRRSARPRWPPRHRWSVGRLPRCAASRA
jgi:hypothetical protein